MLDKIQSYYLLTELRHAFGLVDGRKLIVSLSSPA
jgi:hypothetical protein